MAVSNPNPNSPPQPHWPLQAVSLGEFQPAVLRSRFLLQLVNILAGALLAIILTSMATAATPSPAPIRVALMDFSTDDNSWRSAQAAANFTSLLQIRLAGEPRVEWVERAQLDLARQELKLSEMELIGGASPIRRGKWAKADWLVTGQFSLDDKNQRTLSLEITDLQHADVLASRTITFPGNSTTLIQPAQDQVELAANALHQLLAAARQRQQETEGQIIVAPLFLVNLSEFGFGQGEESLERGFYEALERAATTNRHLRFIRFPKAYRAMDESEMVLDGLVEADPQAWLQTADLYVWGTYAATNSRSGTTFQPMLEFTLHMWDGASRLHTFREKTPVTLGDGLPPAAAAAMLNRMVNRVLAQARRQTPVGDSLVMRREIAESISQAYLRLAGPTHSPLGLHDDAKFAQAVHMLETACFFDPDNANLHAQRITCRWGWWMDFRSKVKNPFWSYWRRSRAWGKYVDRFGLQPVTTPLPFPYGMQGIPGNYVGSLEDVLGRFPQLYDEDEEQQQQHGVHTALMEAQAHGFPKDIPREVVLKWKAEVEAELADRKRRASQYAQSAASVTNNLAKAPSKSLAAPAVRQPPSSPPKTAALTTPAKPASGPQGPFGMPKRISPPAWLKDFKTQFRWFELYPPRGLPAEQKPDAREFQFPPQFEVRAVLQVAPGPGKLLILAMDERSAPTSDATPDLAAEILNQRGRLWSLDLNGQSPVLFEPALLPGDIHSFLLENDRLWVAGETLGCLDLKTRGFRQFGLREGLTSRAIHSLAFADDRLFATGDAFRLYQLEPGASQWQELMLPQASLSMGTGSPCLVAGNRRWLGYVAGSALLYDLTSATWTNLAELRHVHCVAAGESCFWFGGYQGLQRYDLETRAFESWQPPIAIQGFNTFSLGSYQYLGQPRVPAEAVDRMSETIRSFLKGLQKQRALIHQEKLNHHAAIDPLHLNYRMPEDVTALAQDGDFLWVGTSSHSGNCLLVHKPSLSLVGRCSVDGGITCLSVSGRDLWVGTAFGKQLLTRIERQPLLSTPRSQWLSLAISPEERSRLVHGMSTRDQAMYAFYAGDDATVAQLLGSVNPAKASLEEMFLLAFAYDASGLDKPDLAREWYNRIASRYPDSPWAQSSQEFLVASEETRKPQERQERLLAKYDQNRDGVLDQAERLVMEHDPAYQREENFLRQERLNAQLQEIFKKADRNGDGRLDRAELVALRNTVLAWSEAPPEMLAGRKIPVEPLLTKDFPTAAQILKKYDANKDGALDAAEFKALAVDIQKKAQP